MTALTVPLKSSVIKFLLQSVEVATKITVSSVLEICLHQKFTIYTKTQNSVNNCVWGGDFMRLLALPQLEICTLPPCSSSPQQVPDVLR